MDQNGLPPIVDRGLLVQAMGHWPSFHDAHVLSASHSGDRCDVFLHLFRATREVDDRGFFVSTNHHRVHLEMVGVTECSLPKCYESDTLLELRVEGSDDGLCLAFCSVTDQDWHVTCQGVSVAEVVPCRPDGRPVRPAP